MVAQAGLSPSSELAFSDERIETNFSNYSAWHYRSRYTKRNTSISLAKISIKKYFLRLLPLTAPPEEGESSPIGISEEKRRQELDLVQNAAFTGGIMTLFPMHIPCFTMCGEADRSWNGRGWLLFL